MTDHRMILWIGAAVLGLATALTLHAGRRFRRQMRGRAITAADGVYLWSRAGCPFCEDMKRLYASAIAQHWLVVYDTETHAAEAQALGIRSVPTTVVVRAGYIIEAFVGVVPPTQLTPFFAPITGTTGDPR
ncbi:MAG: thioredoxin family protein [Acidiferrobacter sp.]